MNQRVARPCDPQIGGGVYLFHLCRRRSRSRNCSQSRSAARIRTISDALHIAPLALSHSLFLLLQYRPILLGNVRIHMLA